MNLSEEDDTVSGSFLSCEMGIAVPFLFHKNVVRIKYDYSEQHLVQIFSAHVVWSRHCEENRMVNCRAHTDLILL